MHLDEARRPTITVEVGVRGDGTHWFGALGKVIGERLQMIGGKPVAYIRGIPGASLEQLKSFSASLATYGGAAIFHMEGITPEASLHPPPPESIPIQEEDLDLAQATLNAAAAEQADFVSLGCPHLSIKEIARIAELLEGRQVVKEFWITTARPTKQMADQMGYTAVIETSGAKFAVDTCCVVAPIKDRFQTLVTDSAKACYYAASKNRFQTVFLPFDQVVYTALGEQAEQGIKDR
jgi:predicted aconitase